MVRLLKYCLILVILVVVTLWASHNPGQVQVDWLGYEATTSVPFLLLLLLIAAVGIAYFQRGLSALAELPRRYARYRQRRRYAKGHSALSRGLVAVAAGDSGRARREAMKAGDLLQDQSLVLLLSAQAAQLDGNEDAAQKKFEEMADREETAFLGVRGLLGMALRRGDETAALDLARRAYELQSNTPWVQQILFELQVRHGLWKEAQSTLGRATKLGIVDPPESAQKTAVLLLQRADQAETQGRKEDALQLMREAHAKAPTLLPVVLRYADKLIDSGNTRKAAKLIEQAWATQPAAELAALYRRARPGEDAAGLVKAMQRLVKVQPDHPESRLAVAEAAIEARQWQEARTQLRTAAEQEPAPSGRLCTLMAKLEEGENGDTGAARDWLLRANEARTFTVWECGQCGAVSESWEALCSSCGAFDSLVPETVRPAMQAGVEDPAALPIGESVGTTVAEAARSAAATVNAAESARAG